MPTLTTTRWTSRARAASNAKFRMGKTITLTSGADGSFLVADTQNNTLVNVAADVAGAPQNAKFQVVDLGLGRVAFKAGNGRFVSAGKTV